MKKVKYIALILVLALGLIGGAYAYWTDSTVVEGTVTTGTLDVRFREGSPGGLPISVTKGGEAEAMEANFALSEDNKLVTFTIGNLYPVSHFNKGVCLHFGIQNYGSIPVKLSDVQFNKINPDSPLWDYLKVYMHVSEWVNRDPVSPGHLWTKTIQHVYLKDLETIIENALTDEVLEPGHIFNFCSEEENSIYIYLEPNTPEDVQGLEVGFELQSDWVQYNAP